MLNISPTIMKAVAGLIGLVGLFIAMGLVVSPVNGWFLNTQDTCEFNGKRVNVLYIGTAAEAAGEWTEAKTAKLTRDVADCDSAKAITAAATVVTNTGDVVTIGTAVAAGDAIAQGFTGIGKSRFLTRLANGSLIRLIINATAIMLPAGVLIALGMFGYYFASAATGLSQLWSSIVAAIAIIVCAFGVDIILPFAETGLNNIDPVRYTVYASGVGTLGSTLGDFWSIGMFAGLVPVVVNLIRGFVGNKLGNFGLGGNRGGAGVM